MVIPYNLFDPATDCKLVVKELGLIFEIAAGQPLFFPSALYTHYNTILQSMGVRGSIVAWSGASLFQYVDLGCRSVADLSDEEKKMYKAKLREYVQAGFDLFPRFDEKH